MLASCLLALLFGASPEPSAAHEAAHDPEVEPSALDARPDESPSEAASPEARTGSSTTVDSAVADDPPSAPAFDPTMLDGPPEPLDEREPVATTPTDAPSRTLSPEQLAEAVDAAYVELYRPANNPVRFNATARILFANIGGADSVNGRLGGASLDLGPTWNRVAVAVTLRALGGQVRFDPQTTVTTMVGGGPTVGLGRLALLGRGFVDLRLGYDVHYAATTTGPARAPHGPRARVDLGLLLTGQRRWFHGVGVSLGYQRLVGSIGAPLPGANLLTIGVAYWLG